MSEPVEYPDHPETVRYVLPEHPTAEQLGYRLALRDGMYHDDTPSESARIFAGCDVVNDVRRA